jgi:hypothetical protein
MNAQERFRQSIVDLLEQVDARLAAEREVETLDQELARLHDLHASERDALQKSTEQLTREKTQNGKLEALAMSRLQESRDFVTERDMMRANLVALLGVVFDDWQKVDEDPISAAAAACRDDLASRETLSFAVAAERARANRLESDLAYAKNVLEPERLARLAERREHDRELAYAKNVLEPERLARLAERREHDRELAAVIVHDILGTQKLDGNGTVYRFEVPQWRIDELANREIEVDRRDATEFEPVAIEVRAKLKPPEAKP